MKQMKDEEFIQLLSIIPNYPATRFFHISDGGIEFCQGLSSYCKEHDYDYDMMILDDDFQKEIEERLIDLPERSSINALKLGRQRYNIGAKEYDFAFVTMDLTQIDDLELFFKKLYHVVKSGGNLLLFVKKERDDINALKQLLERDLYVAVNHLDLAESYDFISAKRMHGWGN